MIRREVFYKIYNQQENTYTEVSFLLRLQGLAPTLSKKRFQH